MANATWPLAPECEAYLNYMSRIAHTGTFLEQLTLLWAMEILYYRAWSSAAGARKATTFNTSGSSTSSAASSSGRSDGSSQPGGSTPLDSAQSEALRNLINNWSSDDFGAFVEELGNLLDFYGGASDFTKLDEATLAKVQSVWRTTVALERGFWEAGRGALK
ncbi:hypothetical protein OC845_002163 [Tilletia horrida]|nr:hypothetical protein OC845_002163 [Tilletia horrida]